MPACWFSTLRGPTRPCANDAAERLLAKGWGRALLSKLQAMMFRP